MSCPAILSKIRTHLLAIGTLAVATFPSVQPLSAAPENTELEHPSLFFTADEIPAFRERINSIEWAQTAYTKIQANVANCEGIRLPSPNSKIRDEWRPIVHKYPRIAAYAAFLYLIEGQPEHLRLARDYLLQYAEGFEDRINFHNIDDKDGIVIYDTGTLGVFSAWTYDMIYDELTVSERELVEEKLLRAIVETIRRTTETEVSMQDLWAGVEATGKRPRDYDWGPGQWNGNMYCNTGLAAIGFALRDDDLIEHTIGNWKVYLERDMLADGMWQEEDFAYSRFCYASMQTLAEMAYQYGYDENLYTWEVKPRPLEEWNQGYVDAPLYPAEGEASKLRTMKMFLDAQIEWQYPNLGPGNWGWQTNRASFLEKPEHVTFYELGYARYDDPQYGWVLKQLNRAKGNGYTQGLISPILYGGQKIDDAEKPEARSRWFNHSKWVVLKSIEGQAYWGSDSLYAFMPYGAIRTKSLRPLSVDLFAFGKVVAPRVAKYSRLQAHDKDYYMTDDAWNAYLIEGRIPHDLRDEFKASWMRFHDFTPELKIAQACLEIVPRIRPSIWYPEVLERHPENTHVDSRLLAMSSDYVLDILDIRYVEEQGFKRHFDWVWHAFGDLALEGIENGEITHGPWSATWLDPADRIGLRTTMLGSSPRGGTKVSIRKNQFGPYIRAFRGNFGESFIAIHEPFQNDPKIDSITRLSESDGNVAIKIVDEGNYTDYLCVAFATDGVAFETEGESMTVDGNYGYVRVAKGMIVARGDITAFAIKAKHILTVALNGNDVSFSSENGIVTFGQ